MDDTYEQLISIIEKRMNVRDDFDALCRYNIVEGNSSCRVATSDRLQETLHYKSERALSFNIFLDRMQKRFNIFRNEGVMMDEIT